MRDQVEDIRRAITKQLGDRTPEILRPRSRFAGSSKAWMIGIGGAVAALGAGYAALRLAGRQISDLRSILPGFSHDSRGHKMVHGTSGAVMPDVKSQERSSTRGTARRSASSGSSGSRQMSSVGQSSNAGRSSGSSSGQSGRSSGSGSGQSGSASGSSSGQSSSRQRSSAERSTGGGMPNPEQDRRLP